MPTKLEILSVQDGRWRVGLFLQEPQQKGVRINGSLVYMDDDLPQKFPIRACRPRTRILSVVEMLSREKNNNSTMTTATTTTRPCASHPQSTRMLAISSICFLLLLSVVQGHDEYYDEYSSHHGKSGSRKRGYHSSMNKDVCAQNC